MLSSSASLELRSFSSTSLLSGGFDISSSGFGGRVWSSSSVSVRWVSFAWRLSIGASYSAIVDLLVLMDFSGMAFVPR